MVLQAKLTITSTSHSRYNASESVSGFPPHNFAVLAVGHYYSSHWLLGAVFKSLGGLVQDWTFTKEPALS
jgi:hypothetical protein